MERRKPSDGPLVVRDVTDLEDAVAAYRSAGKRVPLIFLTPPEPANEPIERHGVRLDPRTNILEVRGQEHFLTSKAATVLSVLMRNAGHVVSRESLIGQTWGFYRAQHQITVSVYIHGLRRVIDCDPERPRLILTIRRAAGRNGYLFRG